MRYADPSVCPNCRHALPTAAYGCPTCGVDLSSGDAQRLFAALRTADSLLERIRVTLAAPRATAGAGPTAGPASPSMPPAAAEPTPAYPPEPYPRPASADAGGRTGVRASAVPKILLGLGALCVLVAAITFLALAWDQLGIGGRTATLAGLTLASGGCALALTRKGLRAGAETLTTVTFGFLLLDVIGAHYAGWLGDQRGIVATGIGGLVIGAAGAAVTFATRSAEPRPLLTPQIFSGIGLLLAPYALLDIAGSDPWLLVSAAAAALFGLGLAARGLELPVLMWSLLGGAAYWWLLLLGYVLDQTATHPSAHALWVEGHGYASIPLILLSAAPVLLWRDRPGVVAGILTAPAALASYVVLVPALSSAGDVSMAATVIALLAWSVVGVVAPPAARLAATVGIACCGLVSLGTALELAVVGIDRMLPDRVWSDPIGVRADGPDASVSAWWLPVLVLAFAVGLSAISRWWTEPAAFVRRHSVTIATALVVSVAALLSLHAIPVIVVVVLLTATAAAVFGAGLARLPGTGPEHTVLGGAVALVAYLPSLCNPAMTTGVSLSIAAGALAIAVFAESTEAKAIGEAVFAPALGAALWSLGEATGLEPQWRGLAILAILGVAAIARPRPALEAGTALTMVVTTGAALAAVAGGDGDVSRALALHLLTAAAACFGSALLHPTRRALLWPGACLLVLASWVQLSDWGATVEAYTVPLALLLVALGLDRMRRRPDLSSGLALTPGLALGTVPSLVLTLTDPVSLRGLLLGLACLALVLVGAQVRWSGPLLTGAVVGTVVVLATAGPYVSQVPSWVSIGAAGVLLLVVGVTWEARLRNLRDSAAYLSRLR